MGQARSTSSKMWILFFLSFLAGTLALSEGASAFTRFDGRPAGVVMRLAGVARGLGDCSQGGEWIERCYYISAWSHVSTDPRGVFSGPPGEDIAYFMGYGKFRWYHEFDETLPDGTYLPQDEGDEAGAPYGYEGDEIYYTPNPPNRDFSNPQSFRQGILIARRAPIVGTRSYVNLYGESYPWKSFGSAFFRGCFERVVKMFQFKGQNI